MAVLVNSAGGHTSLRTPAPEPGDLAGLRADWQANLDTNLISAVLVTEALPPRLADGARVINIGSIAGSRGGGGQVIHVSGGAYLGR